jgi:outer membrane lipoprotein-sorting protein
VKLLALWAAFLFFLTAPALAAEKTVPPPGQIRSVQADFRQEKRLQILVRPMVSTGTFTFQSPGSLRWEYQNPVQSILLMHGGKVKKFSTRNGVLVEERGMRLDSMQVMLAEISNWLDGRFAANDMFTATFPDARTIVLAPRKQELAALISSIELKLADQAGLLDEVTIFEGPGSSTRLTFSNRILNQAIPLSLFTSK